MCVHGCVLHDEQKVTVKRMQALQSARSSTQKRRNKPCLASPRYVQAALNKEKVIIFISSGIVYSLPLSSPIHHHISLHHIILHHITGFVAKLRRDCLRFPPPPTSPSPSPLPLQLPLLRLAVSTPRLQHWRRCLWFCLSAFEFKLSSNNPSSFIFAKFTEIRSNRACVRCGRLDKWAEARNQTRT